MHVNKRTAQCDVLQRFCKLQYMYPLSTVIELKCIVCIRCNVYAHKHVYLMNTDMHAHILTTHTHAQKNKNKTPTLFSVLADWQLHAIVLLNQSTR